MVLQLLLLLVLGYVYIIYIFLKEICYVENILYKDTGVLFSDFCKYLPNDT
jgi:hypothetical protein